MDYRNVKSYLNQTLETETHLNVNRNLFLAWVSFCLTSKWLNFWRFYFVPGVPFLRPSFEVNFYIAVLVNINNLSKQISASGIVSIHIGTNFYVFSMIISIQMLLFLL